VKVSRRVITGSFVGGVVAGLVLWSLQMRRSRRDLFSPSPLKRLAALGYLAAQPGLESIQILTEYSRWEQDPSLRKRAEHLLKRMQGRLL
jgi:hypothetical protein